MSLRRREGLVKLARKYNALVVCDDVYDFLQWPVGADLQPPSEWPPDMKLPRLCDIDLAMDRAADDPQGFGHAVSNGSFSKLVGPGIRTGWLEGSPAFALGLSQTGSTKSGGSPSQLSAAIMADLVSSGDLENYLEKTVRPALQRRHKLMMDAVHQHLTPHGVKVRESGLLGSRIYGGYFVWLALADEAGVSASVVADAAIREENLAIGSGDMFEVHGDDSVQFDRSIRLTFTWESEEDLVDGVARLGRVLQNVREDPAHYRELSQRMQQPICLSTCK